MVAIPVSSVPGELGESQPGFPVLSQAEQQALQRGEILIHTHAHQPMGAAVTARMYLPKVRSHLWIPLTSYHRWVKYFPNIIRSEVLEHNPKNPQRGHRLYQVGNKAFMMFAAQVEIYLRVFEQQYRSIHFRLERGTFKDFSADLELHDFHNGTLLSYSVQATPLIPVPSFLMQQAIRQDLPGNMENMRRLLCA